MELGHVVGIVGALGAFLWAGIRANRKVKNAEDFDKAGGRNGVFLVCGALLGGLIGGQSTVGTAQLAYTYGLGGIWFTLGAGLGCIILCIGYVIPLRRTNETTLMEVIANEYGPKAELAGSILSSFGTLVSVVSNLIAASALMNILTGCGMAFGCIIAMIFMCIYVVFGGVIGAGMGGIVKLILLYITAAVCLVFTISLAGEIGPGTAIDLKLSDLFARGVTKELCNGASLLIGVLSTQAYAQAIWSAKSDSVARKAALLSGFLTVPVGFGGVLVGLYMRSEMLENPVDAFPMFLMEHVPPLLGGIGMGALMITVIAGGGGLTLGVSTIFVRDILSKISPDFKTGRKHLVAIRLTIICCLIITGTVAILMPRAIINDLGFLSMGLRGAVVFIPLTISLFFKKYFRKGAVALSVAVCPITLLVANMLDLGVEPLLVSVAAGLVTCFAGFRIPEKEK